MRNGIFLPVGRVVFPALIRRFQDVVNTVTSFASTNADKKPSRTYQLNRCCHPAGATFGYNHTHCSQEAVNFAFCQTRAGMVMVIVDFATSATTRIWLSFAHRAAQFCGARSHRVRFAPAPYGDHGGRVKVLAEHLN